MAIESATTIAGLNPAWPQGIDLKSEGDNHIRLIKQVLQAEFPTGAAGVVKPTAQTRSRIVNGAMQISQENGNTAGTVAGYYMADQWQVANTTTATFGAARTASVAPNAIINRALIQISAADASITTNEALRFDQKIEGVRVADFQYGTSAAVQSVLCFGFRGPAGTYAMSLRNGTPDRSYVDTFTITAGQANTDTTQTFVVSGDIGGTWAKDNTVGLWLGVGMAAGPTLQTSTLKGWVAGNFTGHASCTNGAGTNGNTFQIFNVGLYLDPQNTGIAPPWQMPDEAQELAACQRYWNKVTNTFSGNITSGSNYYALSVLNPPMRLNPALSGVNYFATGFPSAVGALQIAGGSTTAVQELRVANASPVYGVFQSNLTFNARM